MPQCEFETGKRHPSGRRGCSVYTDVKCGVEELEKCEFRRAALAKRKITETVAPTKTKAHRKKKAAGGRGR